MLKNYLKIAFRNLRQNRTYTALNVLGLSVGMTGAVLIFLFLQYHLSTDRHQPQFDRVYRVVLDLLLDEGTEHGTDSSVPLAAALAHDYSQIEKAGFIRKNPNTTLSADSRAGLKRFIEKDNVVFADQGFMEMFSFAWIGQNAGRLMKEPYSAVITEKIAEKYFGTKEVVGKTLKFANQTNLRIVGIVKNQRRPSDINFDVFISLPTLKKIDPSYEMDNFGWLSTRNTTFVRLHEGASPKQIESLLKKKGPIYYGETAKYYDHKLQPLSDMHFDQTYDGKIRRSIIMILAGVGVFLLVIACINFVNLATAQALKRTKEIGVRKVLGGTRRQLFWQFICETALITLGSGFTAVILTVCLFPLMNSWIHSQVFRPGMLADAALILFWTLILLLVIIIAGFYPAVIASGFNPISALKGKMITNSSGKFGLRQSLITVQLTIAQILIIGTLVLLLQMKYFQNADLGFDKNAVLTISLPKINPEAGIMRSLRNDLLQYSDISSVTFQYEAPTSSMGYGGSVRFDNRVEWEKFVLRDRFGDENYLTTYKMPLLAGRNLAVRDSVIEFVVNEEFMHKLGILDPQKVLGRQLEDGNSGFKGEIVGVAKSFHLKSLQEAVEPCAIFAHSKLYKEVAVKLNTKDLPKTLQNIKTAWQKTYPDEVLSYQFVDEQIAKFYEKEAQLTTLIQSFAVLAIFICCLGLYGLISFMVTRKTKEIGVRKVLGAGVESIVLLFGKEFLVLILLSFLIAAPIAWYLMQNWLNEFAYRIDLKWWILVSGGMFTMLITLITIGYRVVQAALMNPVKSLKVE